MKDSIPLLMSIAFIFGYLISFITLILFRKGLYSNEEKLKDELKIQKQIAKDNYECYLVTLDRLNKQIEKNNNENTRRKARKLW